MLSVCLGRCLKQWEPEAVPIAPSIGAAQQSEPLAPNNRLQADMIRRGVHAPGVAALRKKKTFLLVEPDGPSRQLQCAGQDGN